MPCRPIYRQRISVQRVYTELVANWQRNGWVTTAKKPVENKDLWERLISLSKIHSINWIKVKGHAENELNNYCDMLARREIKENADRLV